jgi:hypothetical protein
MTEPVEALPESLRSLIHAEKARPEAPAAAQERVLARLSASLGVPGPPGASPSASPVPSTVPPVAPAHGLGHWLARSTRRGLLTFLAGAAVGATIHGGVTRLARAPEPPPVTQPAPALDVVPAALPSSTEPPTPPSPEPAAAAPPVVAVPAAPPRRHSEPSDARDRALAAERKLIEMARTSFVRGQTAAALASLSRHTREFPSGQLSEERESLFVQVLVATGATDQARVRGKRFLQRYPHSLFTPVVEQALRTIP